MYSMEIFQLEDYIQNREKPVKGRVETEKAIDEYLEKKKKEDSTYKGRQRIGESSSKFEALANVRVVNVKLLLNIMEELKLKPVVQKTISSDRKPSVVKTTTEILGEAEKKGKNHYTAQMILKRATTIVKRRTFKVQEGNEDFDFSSASATKFELDGNIEDFKSPTS